MTFRYIALLLIFAGPSHVPTTVTARQLPTSKSPKLTSQNTPCSGPCVLTYHNGLSRDGVTSVETRLTPANVNATNFGKIAAITGLNGQIYAQPLYLSGMNSISSSGNVIFVATQQDWVYAFDADTYTMIWGNSFLFAGEVPLSTGVGKDLPCPNIRPNIGITSTPVIDTLSLSNPNPVIYFVTRSRDANLVYHMRLHAVDVTMGTEVFGGPVDIQTPVGASVSFDPLYLTQRAGLTLTYDSNLNPHIYIAWGSACDHGQFRGWIMDFPVIGGALSQTAANFFVTTVPPDGNEAGVWQSGAALAADSSINGNLYFVTGDGSYDGNVQWGNSVLKLTSNLTVADWYTPNAWPCLNGISGNSNCPANQDLGSGGVVLFNAPDGTPEMVMAGKQGEVYVIYQSNMGHLDPAAVNDQYAPPPTCTTGPPFPIGGPNNIAQCFPGIQRLSPVARETGLRGSAALWNNTLYTVGSTDTLRAFALNPDGTFNTTSAVASTPSFFTYPGATPSISWNGADPSTGIVWVLQTSGYNKPRPAVLRAYTAVPSGGSLQLLYQSKSGPGAVKFVVPTVANGKVFVAGQGLTSAGTEGQLYVYGLRSH